MEYGIISSSYIARLTLLWCSHFSFQLLMDNNLYNDMNNCCKKCLSDRDLCMLDVEFDMVGPTRVIDERVYLSHQNIALVLYKQIPWRLVHKHIGSSSICSIFSTDFIIIFYITTRISTNGNKNDWFCIHFGTHVAPATIFSYWNQYFIDNMVVWYKNQKPSGTTVHCMYNDNQLCEGIADI